MSNRSKGSVRIGPVSLFSLIILLSLAVLSVLAASTAQATYASAEKQAQYITDTYANESAAQELVARVDSELEAVREAGGGQEDALEKLESALPNGARIEDEAVHAQFYQESGRMLTVTLAISNDANYRITQWQATTSWNAGDSEDVLWSGETEESKNG